MMRAKMSPSHVEAHLCGRSRRATVAGLCEVRGATSSRSLATFLAVRRAAVAESLHLRSVRDALVEFAVLRRDHAPVESGSARPARPAQLRGEASI